MKHNHCILGMTAALALAVCTPALAGGGPPPSAGTASRASEITFTGDLQAEPVWSDNRLVITVPASQKPRLTPGAGHTLIPSRGGADPRIYTFVVPDGQEPRWVRTDTGIRITFAPSGAGGAPVVTPTPTPGIDPATPKPGTGGAPGTPGTSGNRGTPAPAGPGKSKKVAGLSQDFSIPESPALTVLGLSATEVTRPSTLQELATSLQNGFDRRGNFQSGVAVDFSPYLLAYGNQLTLGEYQKSRSTQFFANTMLSIATAKALSDADKSTRLALGARLTFLDKGDPRLDAQLIKDFDDIAAQIFPNDPNVKGISIEDAKALHKKALDRSRQRNWNRTSWILGAAPSWISKESNVRHLDWNGGGVWTSYAYGFEGIKGLEHSMQAIAHVRLMFNEQVADPNNAGKFFGQDSFLAGGRIRYGSDRFNASAEASYVKERREGMGSDSLARVGLGVEWRMAEGRWLNLSLLRDIGSNLQNNTSVLASFKLGLGTQARLAP